MSVDSRGRSLPREESERDRSTGELTPPYWNCRTARKSTHTHCHHTRTHSHPPTHPPTMPRASTEPKKKSKGLTLSLNKSSKTVLSGKVKVKLPRQLSTARGPSNPRGPRGDTTLDHIHDVYQPSLEQMESLRSRGAVIRTTRWTPDEIAVLEKNIEAVLKARKADDLSILLESLEKGSEEALDVKRHLSTGIDRPVQQVLRRINRDMVETKHIVYSKEDNTKLMQLSKLHGNDYTKIGELMGRNWCSVRDRLRRANATTVGPWTLEEESKLIKAVRSPPPPPPTASPALPTPPVVLPPPPPPHSRPAPIQIIRQTEH